MKYQVFIDDNFHYMDPDHQSAGQQFATLEEAVAYCQRFVDKDLFSSYRLGMPCYELSAQWAMFGEDPFVRGGEGGVPFSARDYVSERIREVYGDWQDEICDPGSPRFSSIVAVLLSPMVWWRIRRLYPR